MNFLREKGVNELVIGKWMNKTKQKIDLSNWILWFDCVVWTFYRFAFHSTSCYLALSRSVDVFTHIHTALLEQLLHTHTHTPHTFVNSKPISHVASLNLYCSYSIIFSIKLNYIDKKNSNTLTHKDSVYVAFSRRLELDNNNLRE